MLLNMYNNKYFTIYLFTHIYNLFPAKYFQKGLFKKQRFSEMESGVKGEGFGCQSWMLYFVV